MTDLITAEYVRDILDYNAETGDFTWRRREEMPLKWNARFAGHKAGSMAKNGYFRVTINYVDYFAHRLAWLYVTGSWPKEQIDHADLNQLNNRWVNLREATGAQNVCNRRLQSNNKSGFKGVCWDKRFGKWQVSIGLNGKRKTIGYFPEDKLDDAAAAYAKAALELHGEFARIA